MARACWVVSCLVLAQSQLLTEAAAAWMCRKPAAERYISSAVSALFGVSLVRRFSFAPAMEAFVRSPHCTSCLQPVAQWILVATWPWHLTPAAYRLWGLPVNETKVGSFETCVGYSYSVYVQVPCASAHLVHRLLRSIWCNEALCS